LTRIDRQTTTKKTVSTGRTCTCTVNRVEILSCHHVCPETTKGRTRAEQQNQRRLKCSRSAHNHERARSGSKNAELTSGPADVHRCQSGCLASIDHHLTCCVRHVKVGGGCVRGGDEERWSQRGWESDVKIGQEKLTSHASPSRARATSGQELRGS
jgi:hypothetical protein